MLGKFSSIKMGDLNKLLCFMSLLLILSNRLNKRLNKIKLFCHKKDIRRPKTKRPKFGMHFIQITNAISSRIEIT